MKYDPQLWPLSKAKRMLELQPNEINELRICWTLPGRFSKSPKVGPRRFPLVRVEELPRNRSSFPYLGHRNEDECGRNPRFKSMVRIPALDEKTGKLD